MNDGLGTQKDTYSDLPNGAAGLVITLTPEQALQASQAQVAALEVALAGMRDRWMRAEADMANVRARAKKDADDARQYGTQKFATDAVGAAEDLRRGLDSVPHPAPGTGALAQLHDGFTGIERGFIAMLARNGVTRHDPTGTAFDAASHQAVAEEASPGHPPGTILHALTSTWTLNGRLLRPAIVVVAKSASPTLHANANAASLAKGI